MSCPKASRSKGRQAEQSLAAITVRGRAKEISVGAGPLTGKLNSGRLFDPRLDILCGTEDEPVGFVWVQPAKGSQYVSVEQPGYTEVYEIASGLPVRVATVSGVEYERFRASFDLWEHGSDGRLIRKYTLDAVVAG